MKRQAEYIVKFAYSQVKVQDIFMTSVYPPLIDAKSCPFGFLSMRLFYPKYLLITY